MVLGTLMLQLYSCSQNKMHNLPQLLTSFSLQQGPRKQSRSREDGTGYVTTTITTTTTTTTATTTTKTTTTAMTNTTTTPNKSRRY